NYLLLKNRRRHTRSKRDWSSDVCSSDLAESYEENNCRLVLSYEDDAGNVMETKQEFTMTVTQPADDMVMEDDFPVMDEEEPGGQDRKSTRLNSSHVSISYAVFCLKTKKK